MSFNSTTDEPRQKEKKKKIVNINIEVNNGPKNCVRTSGACENVFHERGIKGGVKTLLQASKLAYFDPNMESEKFSEQYPEVLRQLKLLYGKKIMDFEKKYKFDEFWGQTLKTSDFDAKPMVLLLVCPSQTRRSCFPLS